MDYSFLHGRYDGRLQFGLVDTKLMDCRPFAWMTTAEFSLASDSAAIPSLKWNTGHSHLSASGQITDFRHPHLQGSYEAQVDLAEAASIARQRRVRAGVLELKGHGDWSLEQFASNGALALRDLGWQNDQISFSKASINADYSVTDQQLKLSKLQGRIFGGGVTGDAEINQWLAPFQHLSAAARKNLETAIVSAAPLPTKPGVKTPKPKPPAIQNAIVQLQLHDLSAEDLAEALNAPAHPFPHFHPVALASGTLETRWKGTPRDAEVQFALDVTPPERHIPGHLRISAHANGLYYAANDTLNLPQFTLTTPTSHVQASGTLSSASAVRLSVSTSSLADWLPFVDVVRGPAMFPVVLNGSATFTGNMSGSFSSPQLAGNLTVDDFDITLPATANTRPLRTQWDSLSASIQLSFQASPFTSATLHRDDTSAEFDASATLQHGHLTGDSVITLRANLHNTDIAQIQAVTGYNYPIFGKTDLFVQAAGTLSDLHGDGQIHLTNAIAYGETVQQFDSNFHVAHGEFAFDNIHLFHDDSIVTGSAAYRYSSRALSPRSGG